jgi:hypothetical protein
MSGENPKPIVKRTRARKRKFYEIDTDIRRGAPLGVRLEDNKIVPYGARHLPDFVEPPRLVFDRKSGRPPRDLDTCAGFWLVSDKTKTVLEAVDPDAFSFVQCEIRVPQGGVWEGPRHWLCEVARILDALDETRSRVKIGIRDDARYLDNGKKFYQFSINDNLVFREDVVGDAHAFRMPYSRLTVICDQVLKDACKSAGLKGIWFRDASRP